MLVPYYDNKKSSDFDYKNNPYIWVDLDLYLKNLTSEILEEFWDFNWLTEDWLQKLKDYAKTLKLPPVLVKDKFVPFDEFILNAKLFFETWWTCEYGLWKLNSWHHHGVDLVMPKWTPIESFTDWKVYKIIYEKEKNPYGNCVIIESTIDNEIFYFCYCHLDTIEVKANQKIKKREKIWTCGNTGNSTGYHLHFQIDKTALFHPFYSKDLTETKKYTINPWLFLQKNYKSTSDTDNNNEIIISNPNKTKKLKETKNNKTTLVSTKNDDLVDEIMNKLQKSSKSENFIDFFIRAWVIKWQNNDLKLNYPLTRYQFTLILYRLYKAALISLKEKECDLKFQDIKNLDNEFYKALKLVSCNNILHWDWNNFYPWKFLTGAQFLAVLWRLFAGLKDWKWNQWYKPYEKWAINNNLISLKWPYLFKPLPRKIALDILGKLIFSEKLG